MMTMQRYMKAAAIGLAVVLAFVSLDPAHAQKSKRGQAGKAPAPVGTQTLYDRLGGMQGIEELADHFMSMLYTPMTGMAMTGAVTGTPGMTGTNGANGYTNGTSGTTGASGKNGTAGNVGAGISGTNRDDDMGTGRVDRDATGAGTGTDRSVNVDRSGRTAGIDDTDRDARTGATEGTTGMTGTTDRGTERSTTTTTATTEADPRGLLRLHVASRLCIVAGGSCTPPTTALAGISGQYGVSGDQWAQALNSLRTTLGERDISRGDQEEVMTAMAAVMHEASGMDGMGGMGGMDGIHRMDAGTGMDRSTGTTRTGTDADMDRDTTGGYRTR